MRRAPFFCCRLYPVASHLRGYLEDEDLAFVLDVNAGYGPWLVSTERLFDAMNTVADWTTGRTRGLARFER